MGWYRGRLAGAGRWALVVLSGTVAIGCTAAATPAPAPGPRLSVVAALFPLAEVARQVGGGRVAVTDLTPEGTDPRRVAVDAGATAAIDHAALVVDVGLGFQPGVERAAAGARSSVQVLPAAGGADPYVWLDPAAMPRVVAAVAGALERVDPSGTAQYQRGARELTATLGALDISFSSSLADCARHDIVTSYPKFGRLAARYGLTEHAVADAPAGGLVPLEQLIRAKGLATVFTDPLAPLPAAGALARLARVRTGVLDPVEALTPATRARHATYLSLMADDLEALRTALACDTSD